MWLNFLFFVLISSSHAAPDGGHGAAPVGAAGVAKEAGSRMVRPGKRAKSDALVVSRRKIPWVRIAATSRAS
jgi:hypothetical protein